MDARIVLEAPAKINLYLEVGPRRPDGFHPVNTVMQAVELCDRVEIEMENEGNGIRLEVAGDAPAGDENLCVRAAKAFFTWIKKPAGARIRLEKKIPAAAGLGGGSSDAAAVLRGLQLLAAEDMEREDLFELAASLGSDVPFFLVGGTALGTGRGERVFPLVQAPPLPVLLVNPGIELASGRVYERFDEIGGDEPPGKGAAGLIGCLALQQADEIGAHLFNSLQRAAMDLVPAIRKLMEAAERVGADRFLLSGSGPTIFFMNDEKIDPLWKQMKQDAPWTMKTCFRSKGIALLESS